MSDYEVQLPDGRSVVIDAKDEVEASSAARNFMMREGARKKGEEGGFENFQRSFMHAITFGAGDELASALRATLPTSTTSTAPTWSGRYDDELAKQRAQSEGYSAAYPGWDTTAKVGGAVTSLGLLPAKLVGGGTGLGGGLARSAATGAGMGAVTGFNEGEGGFENRLINAGKHGAVGGAAGAVLHPVAAGAGAVVRAAKESAPGLWIADKVIAPGMEVAASTLDRMAPRMGLRSASAAAPEGGQVIADSVPARVAESLRAAAPSSEKILDEAAAARIADTVRRGGDDATSMGMRLDELGPGAMVADVNPMTQRLASTAYISPGPAPKVIDTAMLERNRAISDRFGADIRRSMGDSDPAVLEAQRLRAQRSGEGAGNYADAVGPEAPYVISPEMREVMQEAPAVQRAMDVIEANAADKGRVLTPAQVAHRVKQQLQREADAGFASGKPVDKNDAADLAKRWRTALHKANPAIEAADDAWQAGTKAMEALDLGRQFMKQGTGEVADAVSPAILAQRIPQMTAEEARAFLAGAADTLTAQTRQGLRKARGVASALDENKDLRSKLEAMVSPENARILFNRATSEKVFAGTDRVVRGGSDTSRKLLSALDDAAMGELPTTTQGMVSRAIGGMARLYNKQRAGNEAVRGRTAEMLTTMDPVAIADLREQIARNLAARVGPRTIQRGIAAGSGQQEF